MGNAALAVNGSSEAMLASRYYGDSGSPSDYVLPGN
jgi:hypothetical protein